MLQPVVPVHRPAGPAGLAPAAGARRFLFGHGSGRAGGPSELGPPGRTNSGDNMERISSWARPSAVCAGGATRPSPSADRTQSPTSCWTGTASARQEPFCPAIWTPAFTAGIPRPGTGCPGTRQSRLPPQGMRLQSGPDAAPWGGLLTGRCSLSGFPLGSLRWRRCAPSRRWWRRRWSR